MTSSSAEKRCCKCSTSSATLSVHVHVTSTWTNKVVLYVLVTCFCHQSRPCSCKEMVASYYTYGPLCFVVIQVFIQEHKACEVSLVTHSITCFITSLPFLLLLPCLVAIVVIPLCGLNSSGIICCSLSSPLSPSPLVCLIAPDPRACWLILTYVSDSTDCTS